MSSTKLLVLIMFLSLLTSYVFQVAVSVDRYMLGQEVIELEKQIKSLKETNNELEYKAAVSSSLQTAREKSKTLGFTDMLPSHILFLK